MAGYCDARSNLARACCCALTLSAAIALADAAEPCPGGDAQSIPFDGTMVQFDSLVSRSASGVTKLTHCLKIENHKHEYMVDWEGTDIRDMATTNGVLTTSLTIGDSDPFIKKSTVYLGINRKDVHPGIWWEKSFASRIKEFVITYISGSISTAARGRPDREERLVPVELTFTAAQKGKGAPASLEFFNAAPKGGDIRFTFPEEVQKRFKGLDREMRITKEKTTVSYDPGPGEPARQRVVITFRNSDRQEVARMPINIIASPER